MIMMPGWSWLLRLFLLFIASTPLVNGAAAEKYSRTSAMMSDWTDPKFKKVQVEPEVNQKFCGSDDIAPRFDSPAIRKEYHTLSDDERNRFHECVKRMKNDPFMSNSGVSDFDMFVYNHRNVSAPGAHGGPAFCSFHREYLTRFEQRLRDCHPKCFLPFWDSSFESYLPDPSHSAIFSDDYLGNSFGVVNTGFMAHWQVVPEDCQEMGREVVRECGNDGSLLMTDGKVESFLKKKSFTDICIPYDPSFENDHGDVHAYVGGHMMSLTCASNDVIFYLHHANMDYCFERFRKLHPGTNNSQVYPDDNEVPQYHRKYDPMLPFYEKKNVDGLSNDYTQIWYRYKDSPKKCNDEAECSSKILWCDKLALRCKAKVREAGECTGLPNEACFCRGADQVPQCVVLSDVGTCKCNKGSQQQQVSSQEQQDVSPPCTASADCAKGEWCDRKDGSCRQKVELNGDCTGMPRVACSGNCALPRLINCVQGRCACAVQRCKFDDSECISTALWCNTAKRQCDRKLRIGERCNGLPDKVCKGSCREDEELRCRATCQCVSK